MKRSVFFVALIASALLAVTTTASAQVIIPNFQPVPKVPIPKIDGLPPELQQQLQQIFEQAAAMQGQRGLQGGDGMIRWGGVRLTKADANLQQQLGLPEKEGLVVAQVDPNTAADKAGLKASDVLVKINNKSVPSDLDAFSKLLRDEKVDEAADLVVVRKGKEETLKAVKMPATVQFTPLGGVGKPGRIGIAGLPGVFGGVRINPANPRPNPFGPGQVTKLHLEMNVNGAKITHKQEGDQYSGEYSKGELKIVLTGKIENGLKKPGEVTVTEGKETKKYASPKEVPVQHRPILQQLMQSPLNGLMMMPTVPNLQLFPGLPMIPGIDD